MNNNGSRNGNDDDTNINTHNRASNTNTGVDSGNGTTSNHMSVIIEEETSVSDQLNTRDVGTIPKQLDVTDLYHSLMQ